MFGLALAFLAGVLSTLSPCVLPLVPIVIGTALSAHRYGPAALAAGLALSYVAIGLFLATAGFALSIDQQLFRQVAAILLIAVGAALLLPSLQFRLAAAAAPVGNWVQTRAAAIPTQSLFGQFAVGLVLGAAWSPCVGPTLGAATVLAARGENLGLVSLTMFAFGIGAALPLLAIGLMSRQASTRWREKLVGAGSAGKRMMGLALFTIGVLILSGADKRIETFLVDASPAWLTELTTRF